ncbi:MAG: tyrosine-type recombinase/integrase [Nanoarchaeota archaeon]|nr:tyrosine-type recombinase/integrase [Nanoarchaeota archaeon]
MTFKDRYLKNKQLLLEDPTLNTNNKKVIEEFFKFEEYKLKRKQGLTEVDERSYKTLSHYITRIKNLTQWLNNKDWADLNEEDIKKLIDDLEDGVIKNKYGRRHEDRSLYYQMFCGKFWGLIKKNHIAQGIIDEFSIRGRDFNKQVRFIEFESFRKVVSCINNPIQLCLVWLAWDIGENIGTLLELEACDFQRQINPDTNEAEYLVILPREKLKRSRTPRSELTNYKETVEYLDIVLANLKPNYKEVSNKYVRGRKLSEYYSEGRLFKFGMRSADKFLKRAVELSKVRCMPGGEKVTWKDLRSSMACDLLRKGWSIDEINSRLGHSVASRVITRYVTYLSLDRRKPKAKVHQSNLRKLEFELDKQKELNKLQGLRVENLKKEQDQMKEEFNIQMAKVVSELKEMLKV